MADRDKILEEILGVLPDMSPPWLEYLITLHLASDPNPSHAQIRILDAAFAYGYVKDTEQPAPPGLPPIPPVPVAPPPPAHAVPAPPSVHTGEKRKAPEPADPPNAKKRAIGKTVDFTQTVRPFVQGRDFKYQELSLSYLNAGYPNLPMNYIRRQFHRLQYLTPAYLAIRQELAAGLLNGALLKKRRFTTGLYGAECEASPWFAAEKRALDAYIASGCKDMDILRQAPPQEIDLARPRTPVPPSSQSSNDPSTPVAGPSQSSVPNSTQSSYTSAGSPVKRWNVPRQENRIANQLRESRSPSPLTGRRGSRSPSPIEIETQDSVIVIESQDSVMVIESQEDEPERPQSPLPGPQPSIMECGCCFSEYDFSEMLQCVDGHLFCPDCTKKNAETVVGDNKPDILCMDLTGCRAPFPDEQLQRVLSPETLNLVYRLRRNKDIDDAKIRGLEYCPFCDYAYIIMDDGPTFVCQGPNCKVVSCRKCRRVEHGGKSCEDIAQQEKSSQGEHAIAEAMTKALIRDCPECKTPFMKESGCNKMDCSKCGTVSCYICRQRVPKISPYTHFDRDPDAYHLPPDRRKCPLWDIDRSGRAGGSPTRLHNEAVTRAEREARARHAAQPKLNAPRF
ncbi:pectinesterase [Rhizoctonia solani 123E]|uniref:Pectinesterase n=1 Tax=Rhizoctonia solani 123E TaxID=1423351 RepID=A0A074S2D9_9AGAM|nr:pectinesterase [Rhizoctonia solani 123E]